MLFCPDLEEYRDGRGFYFDPAEVCPGVLVRTIDQLCEVLSALSAIAVSVDAQRKKQRWWASSATPGASERLQRFILDRRELR